MEILSKLTKITSKKAKRVGRGYGSGAGGHTTGKGAKGDKIRGKTKLTFDGTKIKKSWIKRLPYLRGKHLTIAYRRHLKFDLGQISQWFKDGEVVTPKLLVEKANVPVRLSRRPIKILAKGKLDKKVDFEGLSFSRTASKMVIAAGGNIK